MRLRSHTPKSDLTRWERGCRPRPALRLTREPGSKKHDYRGDQNDHEQKVSGHNQVSQLGTPSVVDGEDESLDYPIEASLLPVPAAINPSDERNVWCDGHRAT